MQASPQSTGAAAPDCGTERVLARVLASARETQEANSYDVQFDAFGTRCRVRLTETGARASQLGRQVMQWVAGFEAKYSRFLPDSLISRINASAGGAPVPIDAETEQLFALCDHMHFVTGGVFDPSSLPLVLLWDWKRQPAAVPSEQAVAQAKELCGWRKVQRQPGQVRLPLAGMGLDLGGMGKEFAVDQAVSILSQAGVRGALVDFGADVRVVGLPADGRPGWHIGLDDPRSPGRCWCGLGIRDGAVATSGDYVRKFEIGGKRYGHILDVRTGRPVENGVASVSVHGPNCTYAGMLSTAGFVMGPEEGLRLIEAQMGAAGAFVMERGVITSRRFYEYVAS